MNQLANTEKKNIVEFDADGQHIKLSRDIVIKQFDPNRKMTDPEINYFIAFCQARKLNPFTKEVYSIKYKEDTPAQIVVSKDTILKRALANQNYDGKESGVIIKNIETGAIEYAQGTYYDKDEYKLVGGWCKVFRKNITRPEFCSVELSEVNKKQSLWIISPATMVEKVAKVRALREAFPDDYAGMYDEDELIIKESENDQPVYDPLEATSEDYTAPEQEEVIDIDAL